MITTRFAPSPNGPLHLGHAFSAVIAHDLAREAGGRFILRIEDIDGARSRSELTEEFRRDLEWLGLEWVEVPPQSKRLSSYDLAAAKLRDAGLLYPCICTRNDIQGAGAKIGPMGPIYPGTCRRRGMETGGAVQWRLDMSKALELTGRIDWEDAFTGFQPVDVNELGDVVLLRKDEPSSYHLAATLDDAADGVSLVTRGRDLFAATHVHRLLQALLDLPVPRWHHHPLLLDENGKKLAKRRKSPSLADRRKAGEDGHLLAEQLRLHRFPAGIALESA